MLSLLEWFPKKKNTGIVKTFQKNRPTFQKPISALALYQFDTGDDILASMQKAGDLHRRLSADEGVNVMITLVSDTRDVFFIGGGKVAARIRRLLSVDGTLQSECDRPTAAGQSRRASRCQSQRQRNGVKLQRLVRATHK